MRDTHVCPKCDHREVLRIAQVADVLGDWSDYESEANVDGRPQRAAQSVAFRIARLPNDTGTSAGPTAGIVRAYVCRACGYSELYTDSPASIPVDGTMVSLLRAAEPQGPYR